MGNKRIRQNKRRRKGKDSRKWIGILSVFILGVGLISFYKGKQYISKTNKPNKNVKVQQKVVSVHNNKPQKKFVGTNDEGKKYTYDAKKISERITKRHYFNNGEKIVFLTFDDGSSPSVTPQVLKVLKEEDVKATFFLIGQVIEQGGDASKKLVKEIFNSGHAIANHSYSHDYNILYPNSKLDIEAFKKDFEKNDCILKSILGENFSTRVLRCPGGYRTWKGMNPLNDYLNKTNKVSVDWNALSKDAEGKPKKAEELADLAIESSKGKDVVILLMHDARGKEETAKALPKVIKYFKSKGYKFKTLS
ncbi:polysaccharide deacetylase family protein [Clostridium novyi]|uniref:Xylanase/chitin deacetylase, NodB family n=1 Tax=Clostridium novyi (strain NT) TaxID=386415 RepID=A0PZK1_CLONN|nr:polysaccharide deacetylase family protein [Clostridium novyi]ABK61767.1 xylanase/chitin deacetylase, NodB family [Clostridium novyi NT]KEH85343.1 polysaccharide deacetylase [Clostridium novyi A str. NCTC 538]